MSNVIFFPGQRVRIRGEEWQIKRAIPHGEERWELDVEGLTRIVNGRSFSFLSDLDEVTTLEPDDIELKTATGAKGMKARLYWEAYLRRLLPRNGAIYLGQHGAFETYNYQLDPALKALDQLRPRILIGDAVGLGKTIECGILLSELIRRGRGRRVLSVVPKATLSQFQDEMWGRFSIPFHRLDTHGLERLRQDLPSTMNPFFHFEKAIISIDTLKQKTYIKMLEQCEWDVLIIDECHNVADRSDGTGGSLRHRLAKRISQRANSVILMSATPHDGTKYGFSSLIKLLDRTRISSDKDFSADDVKHHFIRRSRTKVAEQISNKKRRQQHLQPVPLSDKEALVLQEIHNMNERTHMQTMVKRRGARELFQTTLVKSFLSSPQALQDTVDRKLKDIKERSQDDAEMAHMHQSLENIKACLKPITTFSRLRHLGDYLKREPTSGKNRIVIFTERIATLNAIADYMLEQNIADGRYDAKASKQVGKKLICTAHGSMSDVDLNQIVKDFQSQSGAIEILVATNVASEGLNLHHNCHRLIHFDLPWSLITLEQRNGRIDRLGQTKQPHIFYFASTLEKEQRQVDRKQLKDDFWIINKIQARMNIAAEDMDEQVSIVFSDGSTEERANTRFHESHSTATDLATPEQLHAEENVLHDADEDEQAPDNGGGIEDLLRMINEAPEIKRKPLPTLFERSPHDFVKETCTHAHIAIADINDSKATLTLDQALRFEVNRWPLEYRPTAPGDVVALQSNAKKMMAAYDKARDQNLYLTESFMNEIHPLISLLENTAQGFFPGKQVPVVIVKNGDANTVYYLAQATLHNLRNEVVHQFWQVFSHKKGASQLNACFDMEDSKHPHAIATWLNKQMKHMKQSRALNDTESKRIGIWTKKVINEIKALTLAIRSKRGKDDIQKLKEEKNRIVAWERKRRTYLESERARVSSTKHRGAKVYQSKIQKELDTIGVDSKGYQDFINEHLQANESVNIQILGCLIGEGE